MRKTLFVLALAAAILQLVGGNAFAYIYGVDVSYYQGTINWSSLKSAKDFAIMKCSEGTGYVDPQFVYNRSNSRTVGILRGFYHFCRPDLGLAAVDEANFFINSIGSGGLATGEILMCDYEPPSNPPDPVGWVKAFCDQCYSRTGVKPLIYLNLSQINSWDWSRCKNAGYDLSLAYPDGNSNPNTPSTSWGYTQNKQYSWTGSVSGISGDVDLDVWNGDANNFKSHGYGSLGTPTPCVGNNADGRIEVFARGKDNAIWHAAVQTGGGWSDWMSLGGSMEGDPVVANDADGRMEVFCIGTDGSLYRIAQTAANSSWQTSWSNLGGTWNNKPAVAANSDGRLEVFLVGLSGYVYHKWETAANGDWTTSWSTMCPSNYYFSQRDMAAITDNNGNIHVFAVGSDTGIWTCYQTPSWSSWQSLGGQWPGNPAVAKNLDGRLEVFARGNNQAMYHKWQLSNGTWYGSWDGGLGGAWQHDPVIATEANGRILVFCVGNSGNLYSREQTSPGGGWTSSWANYGGSWQADPGAGRNADGRLEIFMVGNDPYMYHKWETSANGSWTTNWQTLGPNTIF